MVWKCIHIIPYSFVKRNKNLYDMKSVLKYSFQVWTKTQPDIHFVSLEIFECTFLIKHLQVTAFISVLIVFSFIKTAMVQN